MRKGILYLFFILSVLSSIMFYSCRHTSSSPSLLIQQKKGEDGEKTYYFSYISGSNVCFSECNQDIEEILKTDDDGNFLIEKVYNQQNNEYKTRIQKTLNEICPLKIGTTSYFSREEYTGIFNNVSNQIGSNNFLSVETLNENTPFLQQWLLEQNINVNNVSHDKQETVMEKCSRDNLQHAIVFKLLTPEQEKANYRNKYYAVGECQNDIYVLAHSSKGFNLDDTEINTADIDYVFMGVYRDEGFTFENAKKIIPNGFRLPKDDECTIELLQNYDIYADIFSKDEKDAASKKLTMSTSEDEGYQGRVWLESKPKTFIPTCMLNVELKSNYEVGKKRAQISNINKNSKLKILFLYKDNALSGGCTYKSYSQYLQDKSKKST